MKTLGEQAKEFRTGKGWNSTQMAKAVGTSRQNIESLEDHGNRIPKYIADLAAVMETTVDDMLQLAHLGPTVPRRRFSGSAETWPFKAIVSKERFERLDPIEQGYVLGKMLDAIKEIEAGRADQDGDQEWGVPEAKARKWSKEEPPPAKQAAKRRKPQL
jgi:DNA-binding XRE family transcriptional regulator